MRIKYLTSLVFIVCAVGCIEKKDIDFVRYEPAFFEEGRLINSFIANRYLITSITDSVGNRLLKYDGALGDTIKLTFESYFGISITTRSYRCSGMYNNIISFQSEGMFIYNDGDVSMLFPVLSDNNGNEEGPFPYKLLRFYRNSAPDKNNYFLDGCGNLYLIVKTHGTKEIYFLSAIR